MQICGELLSCQGSLTSTTRKHLVNLHFNKLDKKDIPGLSQEDNPDADGQGPKLVQRSLI